MNCINSLSFPQSKLGIFEEFKKIAQREGKSKSQLLMDLIEQYVKIHSEGNPMFTMEQFVDPDFRAMPATMSPIKDWKEFINHNTDEKEDRTLELKCLGIIGAIKDKRNAKISNSS